MIYAYHCIVEYTFFYLLCLAKKAAHRVGGELDESALFDA